MKQKKVVVIGGGFAGSLIAKKIQENFETTLIDTKDYFEFTPSILRSIVDPHHLQTIQIDHKKAHTKTSFIKGKVTSFDTKHVYLGKKKIPFDYLVIASGTYYSPPIKSSKVIMTSNAQALQNNYKTLCKAKKVAIVGGGLVGIELAAEIAKTYKKQIKDGKKEVTIYQSNCTLIPRLPKKAQDYATNFLMKYGVKIICNTRMSEKELKAKNGPDIVFMCVGITPNATFIPKKYLSDKKFVNVNEYLQVQGTKNIFAGGDIINIQEEKLAQNAEKHAGIIAHNIQNLENKEPLQRYLPKERTIVISLGKWCGILVDKGKVFTGFFPGVLKTVIEKLVLRTYK